jgi:hypothetical protein
MTWLGLVHKSHSFGRLVLHVAYERRVMTEPIKLKNMKTVFGAAFEHHDAFSIMSHHDRDHRLSSWHHHSRR